MNVRSAVFRGVRFAFLVVTTAAAPMLVRASASASTPPRTWYISHQGDDAADGRSPTHAWQTLTRLAQQRLAPGDAVLLQGGGTFDGTLRLGPNDAGSAIAPVRIGSYGTGRATIAPVGQPGVVVYNTAGVDISDLRIVGDIRTSSSSPGINAFNDLPGNVKLDHLRLNRIEVSGFRIGVAVGGGLGGSGFRDVAVRDAELHDNLEAGAAFYGPKFNANSPVYAHADVLVSGVHAHDNRGDPKELARNTGSGIILGSVSGGLVERSRADHNGAACRAPEGPVGIWAYDSDLVTIQSSISDHNHSAGPADGDGFDLDQNVSHSMLQGNLSFANDGAGFLVYTGLANNAHRNNVVRFNVSVGDGVRLGWYGGITVMGHIQNASVYNNTVVARPTAGELPSPLRLHGDLSAVTVQNNIFFTDGAGPVVDSPAVSTAQVGLSHNDYFATGRGWAVKWGQRTHLTLAEWRGSTGQEVALGRATGIAADPGLQNARVLLLASNRDLSPADLVTLTGLALTPASSVRAAAKLSGSRSNGTTPVFDVFGHPVDLSRPVALGAHQPLAR